MVGIFFTYVFSEIEENFFSHLVIIWKILL